jgi:uncharacterized alkaline shock family protein YloU
VAAEIQRNVKRSIETMTGLTVVEVNVHIHDVQFKSNTSIDKSEDTDAVIRVK